MENILIGLAIVVAAVLVYVYIIRKNKDTGGDGGGVDFPPVDPPVDPPQNEATITTEFDETK
jgi:hypothetical protein